MIISITLWDEHVAAGQALKENDYVMIQNAHARLSQTGRLELYLHGEKGNPTGRKSVAVLEPTHPSYKRVLKAEQTLVPVTSIPQGITLLHPNTLLLQTIQSVLKDERDNAKFRIGGKVCDFLPRDRKAFATTVCLECNKRCFRFI